MAILKNPVLFFTTSPRTPAKMIPEIQLLCEQFSGEKWTKATQKRFADELAQSPFFQGEGSASEKDFSARDRINRAPKALGFVNLKPRIELTEAGNAFVYGKRPQEAFLRQLLKFQVPSPYHKETAKMEGVFWIRPYLEILRLIRELEYLTFDELKIFGLQMTDYRKYEAIKSRILDFREAKERQKGQYKRFVNETWTNAVLKIHRDRIAEGRTKTRETNDASLRKFVETQKGNMRDYADACFRYLRYTGLVSIAYHRKTISIFSDKERDVDYILSAVGRDPVFTDNDGEYKSYLFDTKTPALYTDQIDNITDIIVGISDYARRDLRGYSLEALKDLRDEITARQQESAVQEQVNEIKSRALYADIIDTFRAISAKECYDAPLMFEYNAWRAMTMLDGGNIKGNFKFDDVGQPLSTASGNMPDIECDYGNFALSVEVTLQSGQRQFESEGESVARHYGKLKEKCGKDTYCLFIAPTINASTLAHFYGLNHLNIALYGGKSKIIPLQLKQFIKLLEISRQRPQPAPTDIRRFLDCALTRCESAADETCWSADIQNCVDTWLT